MINYQIGDFIKTKKQHPCGNDIWEITRIGADIKIKCTKCGHVVMIDRAKFIKVVKEVIEKDKKN